MKIISRKTILQADLFKVFEIKIELKNGSIVTHKNVERKKAVTVIPINNENEVFLIKQFRYMHGGEIIEAVAGFVEEGESDEDAVIRELKEEVGIVPNKLKLLTLSKAAGSVINWDQPIFAAQELAFEDATPEENEEISVYKVKIDEAVEMVMSGKIQTASSIIGILMLDKTLKEGKL